MQRDFHYELTECDTTSAGSVAGRWRVSVPRAGVCTGGAPNAPVRLQHCCNFQFLTKKFNRIIDSIRLAALTCPSGQYFDLELLECHDCPAGSYSLGGNMVRHETWDRLAKGFAVLVEPLTSRSSFSVLERERTSTNCSR